jgi:hypothetical protein
MPCAKTPSPDRRQTRPGCRTFPARPRRTGRYCEFLTRETIMSNELMTAIVGGLIGGALGVIGGLVSAY